MTYKKYDFEELTTPLRDMFEQIMAWNKEDNEPLEWTGPNELHHTITATSFSPKEHFEQIKYHEERGRDAWDVLLMVAVQLGIHQGVMIEKEQTDFWKMLAELK